MRFRTAAALIATGVLTLAPTARAQDSGSAQWDGSDVLLPTSSEVSSVRAEAAFVRTPSRQIRVTMSVSGAPEPGCAVPKGGTSGLMRTSERFGLDLVFECNGHYTVTAVANTTDDSIILSHDEAVRAGTVSVAMPAPQVTGVKATAGSGSITITWNDMRFAARDLAGYVVERSIGGGAFTRLTTLASSAMSFVDDALPTKAGEATYRVLSTRPSPAGPRVSAASTSSATPFSGGTGTDTGGDGTSGPPTGDGTTGPPTGDGTTGPPTGTPGAPGDGDGGTTPDGSTGGRGGSGGVQAPRLGIAGTFLPPLLRPQDAVTTPTTIDGGFEEDLPYDDREPGGEDAELPDDDLAAMFGEGGAGRGMLIPVATAVLLAVWAFHLRFLARASKPV